MKNRIVKISLLILIAILIIFCCIFFCWNKNSNLNFAVLSDTHISNKNLNEYSDLKSSKELLKSSIEQINSLKSLDFVIYTGDLADNGTVKNVENFYKIQKKLKHPYYTAFGNHDFYGAKQDDIIKYAKKYNPNYIFDKTYYAFDFKKNYRIIILDSAIKKNDTAKGFLDEKQLEFLQNELDKNKNKIILIALHHPVLPPYEAQNHVLLNADKINEILIKYKNPIIVLSGHYHAFKMQQKNNIIHISNPAVASYPMAFRYIKILNFKDKIKVDIDFISTKLVENKEKNKLNHKNYKIFEGDTQDRINSFIISKKGI